MTFRPQIRVKIHNHKSWLIGTNHKSWLFGLKFMSKFIITNLDLLAPITNLDFSASIRVKIQQLSQILTYWTQNRVKIHKSAAINLGFLVIKCLIQNIYCFRPIFTLFMHLYSSYTFEIHIESIKFIEIIRFSQDISDFQCGVFVKSAGYYV